MTHFKAVPSLLLLLPLVFLFSSCGNHVNLSLLPEAIQNIATNDPVEDAVDDTKELEELEPLMCTDEELIELSRTGGWNDTSSPVTPQQQAGVDFNFPVVLNKQVEMYLNLIQNKQRNQFSKWLARSGKYRTMIEKELEQAGLPKDLLYLAMIESGFNPRAYSRAKAVGLWQFMKGTGRQYNLKINKYVDERRDPAKATRAAVNYLGDLYREFGDWHLAVAAYNGGPGKVRSGLKRHKVSTFWDLASKRHLGLETKRYVPKLIATLLIAKEPEKYGFTHVAYQEPLKYDTLTVGPNMTLKAIALISGSTRKKIKSLNHELRREKTPANMARYKVNIPAGTITLAQKNMKRLHSIVSTGYKSHRIRKGDTLTKICRKYDINKTTLLKVNNLRNNKLSKGQNLRIPYRTITYQLLPEGSMDAMAAYKDSLILHRIKKGDTIGRIAKKYNVPKNMIVAWNGLKNAHSIRAGQQLALYIDNGKAVKTVAQKTAGSSKKTKAHVIISATQYKKHVVDARSSFQYYNVKNGDSLWTISRKFSASTADIKKWNNLKSNLIHPGATLKLKKG